MRVTFRNKPVQQNQCRERKIKRYHSEKAEFLSFVGVCTIVAVYCMTFSSFLRVWQSTETVLLLLSSPWGIRSVIFKPQTLVPYSAKLLYTFNNLFKTSFTQFALKLEKEGRKESSF